MQRPNSCPSQLERLELISYRCRVSVVLCVLCFQCGEGLCVLLYLVVLCTSTYSTVFPYFIVALCLTLITKDKNTSSMLRGSLCAYTPVGCRTRPWLSVCSIISNLLDNLIYVCILKTVWDQLRQSECRMILIQYIINSVYVKVCVLWAARSQ